MAIPVEVVRQLPLLCDLPLIRVESMAMRMQERSFGRREVVFNKGDAGQALYFLVEGRLQAVDFTLDGREVGLYFVESADYFGEMAVIDGQPQPDFVIAVTRSRVALLPVEDARTLITVTPEIARQVLTRLAQRFRSVAAQRTLLGMPSPAQRICAQLTLLTIKGNLGQMEIRNAPTHQEIAIMVNTSRETVTRVFQVLQANGILKREGNKFQVEDSRYLSDVAEGRKEPPKTS